MTAAVVLLLTAAGCSGTAPNANVNDDSLQKVLDAGELVLGLDLGFPPMGFTDSAGEIVGFDIDMAREVCNRLGIKLVPKGIDWGTKEETLNSGKIDCIWNGLSITPARSEAMNMSEPYMKNELIFVVLSNSEAKGARDLEGCTIGVQSGSTAQEILEQTELFNKINILKYQDNKNLLHQLEKGKVDAAFVDSVAAYYFIFSSSEQYYVLPESLDEEEYAIGFRKNDQALRDKVQETLGQMKADGTLGTISKKWFGSDITTVR